MSKQLLGIHIWSEIVVSKAKNLVWRLLSNFQAKGYLASRKIWKFLWWV